MSISLSRESIRLMMQSQRIIKKEFGVRIQLDDEQVMARVFAYAAQSISDELKQCANNLMKQLLPGESDSTEGQAIEKQTSAARIYRGQVVTVETPKPVGQDEETVAETSSGPQKNVIYRGRRVS